MCKSMQPGRAAFVADGESRLRQSTEFQAQLQALKESIQARYAVELAQTKGLARVRLKRRIEQEYRQEARKLIPSAQTLYFCQVPSDESEE